MQQPTDESLDTAEFPIAIIGAGFSGIAAAIALAKAGIRSFRIFEQASEVGGTWRDNTYPGAACDVPSDLYSLSSEPNAAWSHKFSPSWEIQAYILGIVEKWQLRAHLHLNTGIASAAFDEERGMWTLITSAGESVTARAVISGVGGLVDPAMPDIKGIQRFDGEIFHTARWNHDCNLTGRRVAVIGTGASAVQVVPQIAGKVARLEVFQRTPAWVVPQLDSTRSERRKRFFARFPLAQKLVRFSQFLRSEMLGPMVFLDSEQLSSYPQKMSLDFLASQVKDPELRARLTPDFQFGCKRILISDSYWSSFERENVSLVTDPIDQIVETGIETGDGSVHPFDAIVFATGFDLGFASAPFEITGRDGVPISNAWRNGAVAYKGLAMSGFPNWFMLMGPNTGPGHTSVLVFIEAQVAHAVAAIRRLRDENLRFLDIRRDVLERYNASIQGRMKHMVWSSCSSWYLSEDGSNHSLYPGFASEYALRTRRFRMGDYEVARF